MTTHEQQTRVRAAAVQAGAVPFDTEACVDKAIRLMAEASALGAKVVVFPEAFITVYPKGVNYGLVVALDDSPEAVLLLMRGGSAIINPLGQVLASPHFGSESILTADLGLNNIGRDKFDSNVTGHYSRPDVFQLSVNEAPMKAVQAKR